VTTRKVGRKKLTCEELDQEFRELNASQIKANTRLAVKQLVKLKGDARKETGKNVGPGLRMMRAEEEAVDGTRLPPVSVMLKGRGDGRAKNLETKKCESKFSG